eukprot:TRINITY_DN365_c0_g1_i1.p1 TRINITY_DN365_c0_g1~~TRINITY_DN365_c0_g1_i1.p1  ORF type:complete len:102 (+),score=28.54 TRINITY_DN365_c0_g1_i1:69-374(+)
MAQEEAQFIKLTSNDGQVFIIDRRAALVSGTLRAMLGAQEFIENKTGEVPLPDVRGVILERVCDYFYYKLRYTNSTGDFPDFELDPEIALELLMAANYLDT